jgi:hypothetical protein
MPAQKKGGGIEGALREIAMRFPEVQEDVACKGTAVESAAFKAAGSKAFLFVGKTVARLKLERSLPESQKLASRHPESCQVGALGWVTVSLMPDASPKLDVLERWIDESYRLLAGKPAEKPAKPAAKRAAKPAAKSGSKRGKRR